MTRPSRLASLAAQGLPGAPALAPDGWDPHVDEVVAAGFASLLLRAVAAGEVALGPDARDQLRRRTEDEAQMTVRLEAELVRLAPVLERHGGVVLKGAGLAHGAVADPATRPSSDLDLLVAPRSVELVLRDLARLGYRRPRPEPSPHYAARVAKATVVEHPTGLLVDLHRTITLGAAGERIDVDELLAGRTLVTAGPLAIPVPAWEAHLVVVALHAAVGDGLRRLRSIRDVALVAHHPELDPVEALALADRWGVAEAVHRALAAVDQRLGVALPPTLASAATRAGAPVALAGPRHRAEQLRAADLRARATLVRSLVAPAPAFVRWAYGSGPLPALYLARWRDLRSRSFDPAAPRLAR